MSDCSKHKKEVAGISDMKELAEMICDLHYETLAELFGLLSAKLYVDGLKDFQNGREKLGTTLIDAAVEVSYATKLIFQAWQISKPFMDKTPIQ